MIKPSKFDKRLQSISPATLSLIAQIDELKGKWSAGTRLHPIILNRLKQSVLITSTGASTRIEGSKLSDKDVERYMCGIAVEKFANRDTQEVQGYFELLQNVFASWEDLSLNEGLIKHFHKELLKYVEKDIVHRGEYKKSENKVLMVNNKGEEIGVLFDTTPAYLTPLSMQELIEWTKKGLKEKIYHPLLIIANFLVEFLAIHPFQDGNGRLSRILTNLLLIREGYVYMPYVSHEKLIENNKTEYYVALRSSQKTFKTKKSDISSWLQFFLEIILTQSKIAISLLSDENIENMLSQKQLAGWKYLLKVHESSPRDIAKYAAIARPTVNQIMEKLIKMNKIERIGLGRSTRYRIK